MLEARAIHKCLRGLSFKIVGNKGGKTNTTRERDGSHTIGRLFPVSIRRSAVLIDSEVDFPA